MVGKILPWTTRDKAFILMTKRLSDISPPLKKTIKFLLFNEIFNPHWHINYELEIVKK